MLGFLPPSIDDKAMKTIRNVLAVAATVLLLSAQGFAAVDTDAVIDTMTRNAGIDLAAQHDRLLSGELVTSEADGRFEVAKAEIAAAQIMYLPVQVADVAALLAEGRFHSRAKKVQELESADEQVNIVSLDDKAARKLKNAEPGDDFNFSAAEFAQMAAGDDATRTLSSILTARHKAYRQSGLSGIADYQRKKETINIVDYLEDTVKAAKVLPKYFPEFYAALLDYPKTGQSLQHRLFAVAADVEGEPQYLLTHWIIDSAQNYVLVTQRQFYVNHTYDTLQMTFACLPYEKGVLVMMLNQTFTEKVAGFGSGIAHKIGRGRVADAIAESFEFFKTAVK